MRLNFVKASPSQNMTAFITDYVTPSMYVPVANKLMDYEYLHVEQVGFIVGPKEKDAVLRLEMSGGEFCGNALLSAAAYCTHKALTNKEEFYLETSGSDTPLKCQVMKTTRGESQ